MMPTRLPVPSALALLAAASAGAQQLPPVRQLGTTIAKSSEAFVTINAARQLSGGRVLVNDPVGRRVVMFDSTLNSITIVADSTPTTSNAYSSRAGGLLPYRGDSALFVDAASVSMSVIDPNGKISRVISVPRSQDAMFLTGLTGGLPGFDAEGRLIYRGMLRPTFNFGPGQALAAPPPSPDSAPLIRVDLVSRKVDTVAYMKIPNNKMTVSGTPETGIRMMSEINPMPVIDDYAVTSEGAIALLRGRDYHVDWLKSDGSLSPSPKIPFEWQRLDDDAKVAVIDSAKAAMEAARASGALNVNAERQAGMVAGMAMGAGGGGGRTIIMGGPPGAGDGRGGGGGPMGMNMTPNFVSPSELPDYRPAFGAGAARPDAEGNIWVRTSKSINGGPVYDVINKKGEVTDRVVIPSGRQIVGFGKDGSVYLVAREGQTAKLERARIK
jgi:hypothetical protein